MTVRKNQVALSEAEWKALIDALKSTHGIGAAAPAYRAFVKVHTQAMDSGNPTGMSWGVHTMGRMAPGRNFLAWHRQFILRLELRLQQVNVKIALPYWDTITEPTIPDHLGDRALLRDWGIARAWDPSQLPVAADLKAVNAMTTVRSFQSALEATVHGSVHNAVGGDMAGSSSPSDPLFFLHHANIDRIWTAWQKKHAAEIPSNGNETLQPKPLFGVKVSSVLDISKLGYEYA